MKTQLKIAAVLALGFAFQANAFADNKGRGQSSGNRSSNAMHVNQYQNNFKVSQQTTNQTFVNNNKITINDPVKKGPVNQIKQGPDQFKKGPDQFKKGPDQFKNPNGGIVKKPNGQMNNKFVSYGKYSSCKTYNDYKGPCYKGKGYNFYTSYCWNADYGCNIYWCPTTTCWFYWCQPYDCYLPVEYVPCGDYVFVD
ncbi:hypothetical protein BH10PLA2_BH10PLA2_05790 [soil metagenome]